jgi:hypothetical protein
LVQNVRALICGNKWIAKRAGKSRQDIQLANIKIQRMKRGSWGSKTYRKFKDPAKRFRSCSDKLGASGIKEVSRKRSVHPEHVDGLNGTFAKA